MEFRAMRRSRQELSAQECVEILQNATSGVLGLVGDGGYPYTVPLSHVYSNGKLFFHSATAGHKVDAIRAQSKCSFCVINKDDVKPREFTTYFASVIAFGMIHIVDDEQERIQALRLLGQRFGPPNQEGLEEEIERGLNRVLVMCMEIEHLTGKKAIELVQARE